MSSRSTRIPKYRLHKATGQAFVQINGRRRYLGKHGSPESEEKYRRVIAEHLAQPIAADVQSNALNGKHRTSEVITVVELCAAYWLHAKAYYVKDGRPTGEQERIKQAIAAVRRLYGRSGIAEFGPLALQAVQADLVQKNLSRTYINSLCAVIKRMFKWGVSQELVAASIYQALATVPGLRRGRSAARETAPVLPVEDTAVYATIGKLPAVVADMVRFQRLTGCRPGELLAIRPCDVDTSGDVWVYTPESHKMEHRGRERRVFVGKQAQDVLRPYLLRDHEAYCFSPVDSERKRHEEMRARRKSKVQPSQRNRRKANPRRTPTRKYTCSAYRLAIKRACDAADVSRWHPNQLRHTFATEIRREFGLEAAQTLLGHSRADVTQVYAERDHAAAARVAREVG